MAYHQPFEITGFHSCDREVGLKILRGDDTLTQSNNEWDWLGNGVYFWEQNSVRALEYAEESAAGIQYNRKRPTNPFVLGAIIELGNCLNLVEPKSLNIVKQAHDSMVMALDKLNEPIPKNEGPIRRLDCAVIKYLHQIRSIAGDIPFDTIRSPFHEADLLYSTANFSARLHIEICVINPKKIKGYFLPMDINEFNPYLKKDFNKAQYLKDHLKDEKRKENSK